MANPKQINANSAEVAGWEKWLLAIPIALPAAVIIFGIVTMLLLLFGQLHSWLVLLAGVPLSVSVYKTIASRYNNSSLLDKSREDIVVTIVIIISATLWVLFNMQFTSQNIYIYRDPAIYTNNAAILAKEPDLNIVESTVFGDSEDIYGDAVSLGGVEGESSNRLYVHGGQLLSAFLGLLGRIGGNTLLMQANPIFGGLAIVAFYGFARLLVRPVWAGFASLVIAVSLPLIYFSRDTYTEPLTLAFTFSTLSTIWLAQRHKSIFLWLLAGLFVGAGTLVRIDAYMMVAGFLLFIFLWASLASKVERKERFSALVSFVSGAAATSLLGWLLYTELGGKYYHDLRSQFVLQMLLMVSVLISGGVLLYLSWRTGIVKKLDALTRQWRGAVLVALLLCVVLVLASRPFWFTHYTSSQNPIVAGLQADEGNPIEPRGYSEQSLNWIWWYLGPVVSLIGLFGYLLVSYRLVLSKRYEHYLPVVIVFSMTALIYLVRPSITPDQIWAIRRFLPIVLPGVALFAAIGFEYLYSKYIHKHKKGVFMVAALVSLAAPIFISWPFLTKPIFQNQLSYIQSVCTALPDNAAVLLVGGNGANMLQATRTFCEVPAEWVRSPSTETLVSAHRSATDKGYTPIVHILETDLPVLPSPTETTSLGEIHHNDLIRSLYHPPRVLSTEVKTIHLGRLTSDGSVLPVDDH